MGEVRGTGLWTGIDLTTDRAKRTSLPAANLANLITRAFEKGLIIKTMGQALEFAPPLVIRKDEIDEGVRILDEVMAEETRAMGLG